MKIFDKLASLQCKHSLAIIIATLLITGLIGIGITRVAMESDLSKMYPQDLEVYNIADQVKDKFGGSDGTFILVRIENTEKGDIYDIRDPKVIKFITEVQEKMEKEDIIEKATSVGMLFNEDTIPKTLSQSKLMFSNIEGAENFFNKDYSASIIMISSDLGGGEEKIKDLEEKLNEILGESSKPSGVEVYVTGTPQIRKMIFNLLAKDAIFTMSISGAIVFVLLIFMQKSFTKAFLIFSPLAFGLFWTLGIMGILGIKLSVATVGIGAMIIGLGVEYGVFIVSRYQEEREKNSSAEAMRITVNEIGNSVMGSGTTTVAGFLALGLSAIPLLKDLGFSLALGITCSLISAIIINPSLIILEEKFEHWHTEKNHAKFSEKKKKHQKKKDLDKKHHEEAARRKDDKKSDK